MVISAFRHWLHFSAPEVAALVVIHSRCVTYSRWLSACPQLEEQQEHQWRKLCNVLLRTGGSCKVHFSHLKKKKMISDIKCMLYLEYWPHFTLPSDNPFWQGTDAVKVLSSEPSDPFWLWIWKKLFQTPKSTNNTNKPTDWCSGIPATSVFCKVKLLALQRA